MRTAPCVAAQETILIGGFLYKQLKQLTLTDY